VLLDVSQVGLVEQRSAPRVFWGWRLVVRVLGVREHSDFSLLLLGDPVVQ
jgi:hypothetical protein